MQSRIFKLVGTPLQMAWRSQEIARVLYFHGFAMPLANLGIEVSRRGIRWVSGQKGAATGFDQVLGQDLAKVLIELGPTFIKLGQLMASRPDWVGEACAESLKVLFDRVPEVSFKKIKKTLERELGKSKVDKRFREIDPIPLGSASLAQTHTAVLDDGTRVILKIQKPGVGKTVAVDLAILEGFARSASLFFPQLDIQSAFREFKQETLRELNYAFEASNIDRFRRNYRRFFSQSAVSFPRHYPDLSSPRVLTLEPMRGKKMLEMTPGSDAARLAAQKSVEAILEQIFDHGFFHADPHQANVFYIEEEGRIGFIDLGLVGRLTTADKKKFLHVLMAVLKRDKTKVARGLFELGEPGVRTDYAQFEAAIITLLNELKSQGMDGVSLEGLLNRLLKTAREHSIFIPNRYVLMMRSCLLVEGTARQLHPDVSILKIAFPIVSKSLLKTYNPIRRMLGK